MTDFGQGKTDIHDPRFTAAVVLLGRTGAKNFRVGYTREEDGEPTVWYAVCEYKRPAGTPVWKKPIAEAAAALDPVTAVFRLCAELIDGGECQHCHRSTIFDPDPPDNLIDSMLDSMGCRYKWMPDVGEFVRSCTDA